MAKTKLVPGTITRLDYVTAAGNKVSLSGCTPIAEALIYPLLGLNDGQLVELLEAVREARKT